MLAISIGVGVFGITFGVLATTAGLTLAQTCAMSLFVFTGASQFAAVAVVGAGGSGITALGSALLLASRNAVYGVAMARVVRGASPAVSSPPRSLWTSPPRWPLPRTIPTSPRPRSGPPGSTCSCSGTPGHSWGRWAETPSAIRRRSAWTLRFPPASSPCWPRSSAADLLLVAAVTGAVIALTTIPFLPVGAPVLLASLGTAVGALVADRPESRSVSWAVLLALAAGSCALKALGLLGLPQLEVTAACSSRSPRSFRAAVLAGWWSS